MASVKHPSVFALPSDEKTNSLVLREDLPGALKGIFSERKMRKPIEQKKLDHSCNAGQFVKII
jgi:hypothetical protein